MFLLCFLLLSQKQQQPAFCCYNGLQGRSIMAFNLDFYLCTGNLTLFTVLWWWFTLCLFIYFCHWFRNIYLSSVLFGSSCIYYLVGYFKSKDVVVSCDFSTFYLFCQLRTTAVLLKGRTYNDMNRACFFKELGSDKKL